MDCDKFQELWPLWTEGELDSEKEKLLGEHLALCERCRVEFANYKAAFEGVRNLAPKPLDSGFASRVTDAYLSRYGAKVIDARDRFRARGRWWTIAVAAAALVVGLLLGRVSFRRPGPESNPPVTTVDAQNPLDSQQGISVAGNSTDMYVQAVDVCLDQHEFDQWNAEWMASIDETNPF